jgi:hypothetical protein
MKTILRTACFVLIAGLLTIDVAMAQERAKGVRPSPNATVSQDIGTTTVTVTYGRPGLKGRTLESLAPAGAVWRTGANEATTITFSDDVMFGGEEVAAGTYTLYTVPGDKWMVILNTNLTRDDGTPMWGAYGYDESTELLRIPAAVTTTEAPNMEWFTIYFDTLTDTKAHLNLHWGTTMAAVPITTE